MYCDYFQLQMYKYTEIQNMQNTKKQKYKN